MANRGWYATREAIKAAAPSTRGQQSNANLDRVIDAETRHIERATDTWFFPRIQTRSYRWPQDHPSLRPQTLELDQWLLSISTDGLTDEGDTAVEVDTANVYLEPANFGPPYRRIEVNAATTTLIEAGDTSQRAVRVTGSWARSNTTESAGTVVSGLSSGTTATSMVCSNGAAIGVGDVLLIQDEQVFVTEKSTVDTAVNLSGNLLAAVADTAVALSGAPAVAVNVGEIIQIDSEQMRVTSVLTTTSLVVQRAWDGTTLAAHTTAADVYALRTLTIERAVNGTTAATHADATAVARYVVPADVEALCVARVVSTLTREASGWSGEIGQGEGQQPIRGDNALYFMEMEVVRAHGWSPWNFG